MTSGVLDRVRSSTSYDTAPVSRLSGVVGLALGLAAALVGVRLGTWSAGLPMLTWGLVAAGLLIAILSKSGRSLLSLRLGAVDFAFVLYALVRLVVELINASDLAHPVSPQVVVDVLVTYAALVAARLAVTNPAEMSRFLTWFVVPILLVAPLAIAQFLRVPGVGEFIIQFTSAGGFERRFTLGYEIRATSTLGHHTQLGGYLVALSAAIGVDMLIRRRLGRNISFPVIALMLVLVAQVTTLTFATIGATAVIVLVTMFAVGIRPLPLIALGAMSMVAWSAFGASIEQRIENQEVVRSEEFSWLPETIAYRAGIWVHETLPAIGQRPWTGWGFDVYAAPNKAWPIRPMSIEWPSPESEYMRVLMTGGVISMVFEIVLFIAAATVIFWTARRVAGRVVAPVIAAFAALLIISVIHNHLSSYGAPLVFWPVVGIVIAMRDSWRLRPESPSGEAIMAQPETGGATSG